MGIIKQSINVRSAEKKNTDVYIKINPSSSSRQDKRLFIITVSEAIISIHVTIGIQSYLDILDTRWRRRIVINKAARRAINTPNAVNATMTSEMGVW